MQARLEIPERFSSNEIYDPDVRRDTAIVSSSSRALPQHQPSDTAEVAVFLVEFKHSGVEFWTSLERNESLAECQERLGNLAETYLIDSKVKVYLEDEDVADTMRELAERGVVLHGARGDAHRSKTVYLGDLCARHIIASITYKKVIDEALAHARRRAARPDRRKDGRKAYKVRELTRGHLHVRKSHVTGAHNMDSLDTVAPDTGVGTDETACVTESPTYEDVIDLTEDDNAAIKCDDNNDDSDGNISDASPAPTELDSDESAVEGGHSKDEEEALSIYIGILLIKRPTSEIASTTVMRERCPSKIQPRKKARINLQNFMHRTQVSPSSSQSQSQVNHSQSLSSATQPSSNGSLGSLQHTITTMSMCDSPEFRVGEES